MPVHRRVFLSDIPKLQKASESGYLTQEKSKSQEK